MEIGGKVVINTANIIVNDDVNGNIISKSLELNMTIRAEINGLELDEYTIINRHRLSELDAIKTNEILYKSN